MWDIDDEMQMLRYIDGGYTRTEKDDERGTLIYICMFLAECAVAAETGKGAASSVCAHFSVFFFNLFVSFKRMYTVVPFSYRFGLIYSYACQHVYVSVSYACQHVCMVVWSGKCSLRSLQWRRFVCLYVYFWMSVCLYICMSVSVCMCMCVCLSVCLSSCTHQAL